MAKKNKLYTEESIQSLSPLEFTRLRPGVYCGSTEYSTQLLIEIVSNAVDEFKAGHGDTIKVDILKDNTIIVEDNGQGFIPNAIREDGKTVLEASFSVLNTSGKYSEDGVYEGTALGLNGIGSKLCVYLSHWAEVMSWRDGKYEHVWFKEGVFDKRDLGNWKNAEKPSGTLVQWKPSEEFFNHVEVDMNVIKKLFKVIACLCPGLKIVLNGEEFYSQNGLSDLVDEAVKDTEILKNRLNIQHSDGKNKLDLSLTYTDSYSSIIVPYVNTGLTDSGPHITQIKTILTREMNKFFREKKWLKEKEENLSGEDCQEGMYIVFNITAPGVSYDAQTKSRIVKLDMTPFSNVISDEIRNWLVQNEKDVKIIADKALNARKAREAAKKARDAARESKNKKSKLLNLPTKLVDAWSKKRSDCELLIAEGDSAASGLIGARDGETQAVFPIRGKIISCLKQSSEKILANQEVVNIIKALGLELNTKTGKMVYDESKLRYGKIIMCCDADPDGESIKNLLLTCFWSLCPELIINGHLYAAIPPLFRITTKKNEYIYLRDVEALEKYKEEHKGEKYLVNRNKGLGEQDADELEECLLNRDTRNVVQITVADQKKAGDLFEILMGPSVAPRRDYMLKHAEEANN
jgi:DNA gyrase/topoisomerase IV subunit B